jgi:large subunit ribosomal protein L44
LFYLIQDKAQKEEPAIYKVADALKSIQKTKTDTTPPAVTSWIVESLVGLIYQEMGAKEAREFISKHVLSRTVDTEAHYNNYLKMRAPKLILSRLLKTQGKPAAVARLLKESGRTSSTPVFIVGIYSGTEKIGESYGSSLKMAEVKVFFNLIVGC